MAPSGEGGLILPKGLDLKTVIFIASLGASFWAQWAIFTEKANNQAVTISQLYGKVDAIDDRIRQLEREMDVVKTQVEYAIEAVRKRTELKVDPTPHKTPAGLSVPSIGFK